jgi:hypothetical protein
MLRSHAGCLPRGLRVASDFVDRTQEVDGSSPARWDAVCVSWPTRADRITRRQRSFSPRSLSVIGRSWATALYAGLRRGGAPCEDDDPRERAYDDKGRVEIDPKTAPAAERFRSLGRSTMSCARDGTSVSSSARAPETPSSLQRLAPNSASVEARRRRGHRPPRSAAHLRVGSHRRWRECEGDQAYMGHASIQTTHDLYGKLMPGSESEAVALVDAYLARLDRLAPLGHAA